MAKEMSKTDEAIVRALKASQGSRSAEDELRAEFTAFRRQLFARLRELQDEAFRQAKKGKPALLRMLLRFRV
jgi:hypothetical protein